jgi:hypothetical protein
MRSHANEDGLWLAVGVAVALLLIIGGLYYVYGNQKQVVSVESGKCTCNDIPDLKGRMVEVKAAIAEYRLAIQDVQNHDEQTGRTTMYNDDTYNEEQENVQNAIKGANTPGTHSGSGKTGTDCGTTVSAATPCLEGSFQTHENVHAAACLRSKTNNYKETMSMVNYWNEEITAYSAELSYLSNEIGNAVKGPACPPRYECRKGSGFMYDDVTDCLKNCIRKIATLDNWCWEYNPKDNTYTGKKY